MVNKGREGKDVVAQTPMLLMGMLMWRMVNWSVLSHSRNGTPGCAASVAALPTDARPKTATTMNHTKDTITKVSLSLLSKRWRVQHLLVSLEK